MVELDIVPKVASQPLESPLVIVSRHGVVQNRSEFAVSLNLR